MHNYYSEFLKSFKAFIGKVTNDSITYYEFDYGSKTIDFYKLIQDESFEYPTCIIEMQDAQLVDGVGPIARNAMMNINPSNHNMVIAENFTKPNIIMMDKRWVNITFSVSINLEDSASLLNYHDLFISQLPFNFTFYDYSYISFIDVTPLVQGWDFDNDDISNIFVRKDPTSARNKYYAMVDNKPLLELTSITKQNDKDGMGHQLNMTFETMIEIPNLLRSKSYQEVKSISVIIDTVGQQDYPILIDIPDNILTNKNIEKGIILKSQAFHLGINDERSYLEINSNVDITSYELALWVVEDSTRAASKRILIPLKNSRIQTINDDQGNFLRHEIEFNEIDWFKNFQFDDQFNFINLILFKE